MSIAAAPDEAPPAYGQVEALRRQLEFVCDFHKPVNEVLGVDRSPNGSQQVGYCSAAGWQYYS